MSIFVEPSNPRLSSPVDPVPLSEINSQAIQDTIELMLNVARGERDDPNSSVMVGLAACQIGIYKQIILVDVGANHNRDLGQLQVFINPVITYKSEQQEDGREGCYSVDSRVRGRLPRSYSITYTAYDRTGNPISGELTGFTARIFQHEVDHLNGIRFPDRVACSGGCLHWVEEAEALEYRKSWQTWPHSISKETWDAMKIGRYQEKDQH